ncbi:hypothetical protein HNP86_001566 [Methanococcus maripaludis]|uniref:Uncharacterized protein n=1 Tax=Methanococcus maripaludis TaxID=39152 RepID=A0A7J9NRM7_METMI|nr:hypothetical protein [Methanococcus maripaludis]MBA2846161.1 hypothetical protein [Methanococcus maripaludis]MBA2851413.1 hypothetical protein [Methanococcus maripaludis]
MERYHMSFAEGEKKSYEDKGLEMGFSNLNIFAKVSMNFMYKFYEKGGETLDTKLDKIILLLENAQFATRESNDKVTTALQDLSDYLVSIYTDTEIQDMYVKIKDYLRSKDEDVWTAWDEILVVLNYATDDRKINLFKYILANHREFGATVEQRVEDGKVYFRLRDVMLPMGEEYEIVVRN